EIAASETLASAQRPGATHFYLDAARTAREVEDWPLSVGQRVFVGFKRMHTLPTPISSLRLLDAGNDGVSGEREDLGASPLVRELAERMHIEPLHYPTVSDARDRLR